MKWIKIIIFTFLLNVQGKCESEYEVDQTLIFPFLLNVQNECKSEHEMDQNNSIFIFLLNVQSKCKSEHEIDQNNNISISPELPRRMQTSINMNGSKQ